MEYHRALVTERRPPTRSGVRHTLDEIIDDLSARLISLFTQDDWGRRPIYGAAQMFQTHPDWRDLIAFPEYFHGDNGAGLGAWHQTGWTALVADLILTLRRRTVQLGSPRKVYPRRPGPGLIVVTVGDLIGVGRDEP
ncbi:uncharacterized protein GAR05_01496 [Micromonospora saelicesensis]|uniref:Uncharacterized protein n=2 Tax=Micromonospora saelicesensis TaxID=285676 RepID=A0ABX9CNP5_9ACTN|nr:uncharacterized protein GAR05_01496 [Micromonospora saelicesensis]